MKSFNSNLKRFIAALAIVLFLLPTFSSCKKGEGDPLLSMHSRKARITGDWIVKSWIEEKTDSNNIATYHSNTITAETSLFKIEDNILILESSKINYDSWNKLIETLKGRGKATVEFSFAKDGTYKRITKYDSLNIEIRAGLKVTNIFLSQKYETTGTWNFLGRVEEDYKNKERIILNRLKEKIHYTYLQDGILETGTEINTFANGQISEVWHIHTLKNKEIILDSELNNTMLHAFVLSQSTGYYPISSGSNINGTVKVILKK